MPETVPVLRPRAEARHGAPAVDVGIRLPLLGRLGVEEEVGTDPCRERQPPVEEGGAGPGLGGMPVPMVVRNVPLVQVGEADGEVFPQPLRYSSCQEQEVSP